MGYMSIMLIVWGAFVACLLGLLAYNATLTRYEEDQLFLTDTNEVEKNHQSDILKKIGRTQPFIRVLGSVSGLLTLAVAGMYTYDAWQRLQ